MATLVSRAIVLLDRVEPDDMVLILKLLQKLLHPAVSSSHNRPRALTTNDLEPSRYPPCTIKFMKWNRRNTHRSPHIARLRASEKFAEASTPGALRLRRHGYLRSRSGSFAILAAIRRAHEPFHRHAPGGLILEVDIRESLAEEEASRPPLPCFILGWQISSGSLFRREA